MQGDSMEMGGDPTKGIWWVKEKICWRTNFGSHQLHMSLTHGVRHFRFCNRSHIIYAMWGWKVAPMCISIQRSKRCWEELWCAWQGNAGDNTSTRDMETLFGGGKAWNRYMDWSSKSQILYDCQKLNCFYLFLLTLWKMPQWYRHMYMPSLMQMLINFAEGTVHQSSSMVTAFDPSPPMPSTSAPLTLEQ